ncbi:MAG: hypothetical protein ACEPOV_05740 [Hyphomicrobiales bacterium]
MKTALSKVILFFVLLFLCASCGTNIGTQVKNNDTPVMKVLSYDVNSDRNIASLYNGYDIEVSLSEPSSLDVVDLSISKDNHLLANKAFESDPIKTIYIGDVNKDNLPEVFFVNQSVGSGAYGEVIGYAFKNDRFIRINTPTLPTKFESSYQGHDKYSMNSDTLVRVFPVYKDNDSNINPSGGKVILKYTLNKNLEWVQQSITSSAE